MKPVDHSLTAFQRMIYRQTCSRNGAVREVMPWILDPRNLEAAWRRAAAADGAKTPGPDGKTVADFARRKRAWLDQLAKQLRRGKFMPSAPRYVDVPKSGDSRETRRLGILNVADRVVHTAVKQVFEPIFDPTFDPCSYGFRPGRSVPGALADAVRKLNGSQARRPVYRYACKLDVARCFDTIDHKLLDAQLREVVADETAMELVGQLLQVGGSRIGWWWKRRSVGVVQGGALSPLLCNVYLDKLDKRISDFSRQSGGAVQLLRYADDLLVLAASRRWVGRAVAEVRRVLAELRLSLKRSKSAVVRTTRGVRWLGLELQPRKNRAGTFRHSGLKGALHKRFAHLFFLRRGNSCPQFMYVIPDDKLRRMTDHIREMTAPPAKRLAAAVFNLDAWLESLNEQLDDWWQAYARAENAPAVFREVDEFAVQRVAELLFAVTGERRKSLYRRFGARVGGRRTWRVNGTTLSALSARPCPRRIIGSPPPVWRE